MESVWYKKIENKVLEQNEQLYKKDFRFYQVDVFLKLAKKVDEFNSCKTCKQLKSQIEEVAGNLSDYLKGDVGSRRNYERKLNEISKHIKVVHKIYPKQHNLYTFSFYGIASGLGLGALIAYIIDKNYIEEGLIIGFTIGVIVGRIIGKIKDKRFHQEGKTLE